MSANRTRKRIFIALGAIVIGIAVILLSLPLWFPWLLTSLAPRFGASVESYDRENYSRLVIHGLTFTNKNVEVEAKRVETYSPASWIWNKQREKRNDEFVVIDGWRTELKQAPKEKDSKKTSAKDSVQRLDQLAAMLRSWVPKAVLRDGEIYVGTNEISIPELVWNNGQAEASVVIPRLGYKAEVTADLSSSNNYSAAVRIPELSVNSTLKISESPADVKASGQIQWLTNKLNWTAQFEGEATLPSKATIESGAFSIPTEQIRLPEYQSLSGSLNGNWEDGNYKISLAASALPKSTNEGQMLPPVKVDISATGDTNRVSVNRLEVTTPWLQLHLSNQVELVYSGVQMANPAELTFAGDLEHLPWEELAGTLQGRIQISPGTNKFPELDLSANAKNLKGFGFAVEHGQVGGALRWPILQLNSLSAWMAEGVSIEAASIVDLEKEIISNGRLSVLGQPGKKFLPPEYNYDHASVVMQFSGSIKELHHSGALEVFGVRGSKLKNPATLSASWTGNHLDLPSLDLNLNSGPEELRVSSSVNVATNGAVISLKNLQLNRQNNLLFRLEAPAQVSVFRIQPTNQAPNQLQFLVEPSRFTGVEGGFQLSARGTWPLDATFYVAADKLSTRLLEGYVEKLPVEVNLNRMEFSGGWTNGPLSFQFFSDVNVQSRGESYPIMARLSGSAAGLAVEGLQVMRQSAPIVTAKGTVPVAIYPSQGGHYLQVVTNREIDFQSVLSPDSAFWDEVGRLTDSTLVVPEVRIAVTGPLNSPQGSIQASSKKIDLQRYVKGQKIPPIENLEATLILNRRVAMLQALTLQIGGQPVAARAEIPLTEDYTSLKRLLDLNRAAGKLRIDRAEVSILAEMFPNVLSPQGEIDVNIEVLPNDNWAGYLTIQNVSTRPLPPLGPIHNVNVNLQFSGREIEVKQLAGSLGGEPVTFSGTVDLGARNETTGVPILNLDLRGQNVPLARRSNLILRSDLDVRLSNSLTQRTVLSGEVRLRDSIFLSDLRALVPGKIAAPSRRPPYFSVEAPVLQDWGLNLRVHGDEFLKVRSPLFRGEVSSALKIEGTLREPIAMGEVRVTSGVVQFPFANLEITQGLVSLTADNPHQPELLINASARVFDYDVQMEVTGRANEPIITFSSTPPLSSEQIVLMLTTGEMPRNDFTFSNQQRATRLGLFIGRNLLSRFGNGGGADRLTIRSGESISEEGKQTYSVEYRLNEDWSLVGEYDRFSEFNAGVKWKFFSR